LLSIVIKSYKELTLDELYSILQLRSQVFVVEQNCVYQDIDSKDQKALHIIGYKDNEIVAYTRTFKPGDYFKNASIGRVVVTEKYRRYKYGYDIMNASIKAIHNFYNKTVIEISAQTYLEKFYNDLGFFREGKEYLEDGIPHIRMFRK